MIAIPQPRLNQIQNGEALLTPEEMADGWHFSDEWDDIMGSLADGVDLAKRLNTRVTLENLANQPCFTIESSGAYRARP